MQMQNFVDYRENAEEKQPLVKGLITPISVHLFSYCYVYIPIILNTFMCT